MTRGLCRALVRAASFAAPRDARARFHHEWRAEMDYGWSRSGAGRIARRLSLTRRAGSAVVHAVFLRKERLSMEWLFRDVRFAARTLWRQPGFAAVAVLTIALGIGANTAIFSIVNRTLLTPLPFGHPDRLVEVWETVPSQHIMNNTPAPATLDVWRERSHLATGFAAYSSATVNLTGDGPPERLRALRASAALLPVLELPPSIGRGFSSDEDRFGGPRAALLTHALWLKRFHADPSIVGRTITLDGQAALVAGVLPEDVPMSLAAADIWIPLALKPTENRQSRMLWVIARLRDGATASALAQELDATMHQAGPGQLPEGVGVAVNTMEDELRGGVRPDLLMIFGVSGAVLLIACANVATMLLARGLSRRRELAVRASLGAGRAQLARMLLAESVVLGAAGGLAGLALGAAAVKTLQSLMPAALAAVVSSDLDGRVAAFAFTLGIVASAIAGLVPLAGLGAGSLTVSARGTGQDERPSASWLRAGLISGQMALAIVLLAGATLLGRTFLDIVLTPTGFTAAGVLTAQVPRADDDDARRTEFYAQLLDSARAIPGVQSAGLINGVPIRWSGGGSGFETDAEPAVSVPGHHRIVSGGYFDALGIPLLAGQTFSGAERQGGESVVIVSESFAKAGWPGAPSPVGRRLRWGADGSWSRVIGVVGDVRLTRSSQPEPHVYLPYTQVQYPFYAPSDLVLKTAAHPAALAADVREAVRRIDPNQPVANVMTMDELLARSMGGRRFTLSLMGVFAALALLLCAIGIYGVLSYTVRRRAREFGVRLAIGATAGRLRRRVLVEGLVLTIAGAAVGGAGAALLSRWLSSVVPGMAGLDAAVVAAAAGVLIGVSVVACDIPARRAMRVDPIVALRSE